MTNVDKLIGNIHAAVSNDPAVRLDIVKLYNCTTFDIMGELTFGESLGLLDKSEYSPWVSAIFRSVKAIEFGRLSLEYPVLRRIMNLILPASISKGEDEHYKYSSDRVDRRLEKGTDQADIWNLVLHKNAGVLNLDEMHANGMVFMIAGTETTATLLSGLTYSLLTNPDKLQRAVEEVRSLPEDQLNLEVLPRLKYLSACFDEGLRTYPPVPTAMLREAPEGGNVICGEWVPAKVYYSTPNFGEVRLWCKANINNSQTRIGIPQYAAYHSASNFKNPDSFVPERWLPGTGYDGDKKEVLQPFLYGPRNCIGKKYVQELQK